MKIPVYGTPKSPKYPRVPLYTLDSLIKLLDELKKNPSDSLLLKIKAVLAAINDELPKENMDLSLLFHESLKAFKKPTMANSIFLLLSRLNTLVVLTTCSISTST